MVNQSLEKFTLKMVEAVEMPEQVYNKEKKTFDKTGEKVIMYGYTFISLEGLEKMYFMKNPDQLDLRNMEGKSGFIVLNSQFDDYNRKVKTQLHAFVEKPYQLGEVQTDKK